MKVLLAPAQFKESIRAAEVAVCWQEALAAAGVESVCQPISDGGEGFLEVFVNAGGKEIHANSVNALGEPINSSYVKHNGVAYIEMSRASGLELIPIEVRDPLKSTTFGTGILIEAAIDQGARRIVVGMGGSATNDGGLGVFRAMGGKILKGRGEVEYLWDIDSTCTLDISGFPSGYPVITGATDVQNPLLGNHGATYVYGEQKGLDPGLFEEMDRKMALWADLVEGWKGASFTQVPGAGAAGGLGFGLKGLFDASLESGFDIISETMNLENQIAAADLVVTGEGKIDSQSQFGKAPYRLIQMCRALDTPVLVIAGVVAQEPEGIAGSCSLLTLAGNRDEAMRNPKPYLTQAINILVEPYL